MSRLGRLVIPLLPLAAFFFSSSSVRADTNPIITEPTDFWFSYSEPTQFLAETYQSPGFESDPQLWLYNDDTGELIITNDDYIGLQSKIDLPLPAGSYRLRASTCCYEPDVWRDGVVWNIQYELSFNGNPVNTTIAETTTTLEETTTSTSTTTTTTTSTTSTSVPDSTTSSSTSLPTVTTTWVEETTVAPVTTTSTVVPVTTVPVTTNAPVESVPVGTTTTSSTSTTTTSEVPTESVPEQEGPEPTLPEPAPEEDEEVTAEEIIKELDDIENLTEQEVINLIDGIVTADLTDEEAESIAIALSSAPEEVKALFEQEVNVFSGQFDSYIPIDSIVSVGTRRTLIATTAAVGMVAVAPRRKL